MSNYVLKDKAEIKKMLIECIGYIAECDDEAFVREMRDTAMFLRVHANNRLMRFMHADVQCHRIED